MTLGQWMIIWLAVLLVVVFGAHWLLVRWFRKTEGYRAYIEGRPRRDL